MEIIFETNGVRRPSAEAVLNLFVQAGISKPAWTEERMTRSLSGCTTIVCAWHGEELIGFGSALSDRAWIAYLSQLAVNPKFQNQGIGKQLIKNIIQDLGDEVTLVVHSAEKALGFYQSVGFRQYSNVLVKERIR